MDIPELLTPQDVAKILKKSVQWVYRNRIMLGGFKIDKNKKSGAVFFTADSINRAIKAGQEEALNEIERWENFRKEQKKTEAKE